MTLTVTTPDPTDHPPIYLGVGHFIIVHESATFVNGDIVTADLAYTGTSAVYPMAFGRAVLAGASVQVGVPMGPVGSPARGAALGQALDLYLTATHAGSFSPYDSATISGVFVHDPVSGAVSTNSLQGEILAAVQHTFPATS